MTFEPEYVQAAGRGLYALDGPTGDFDALTEPDRQTWLAKGYSVLVLLGVNRVRRIFSK